MNKESLAILDTIIRECTLAMVNENLELKPVPDEHEEMSEGEISLF